MGLPYRSGVDHVGGICGLRVGSASGSARAPAIAGGVADGEVRGRERERDGGWADSGRVLMEDLEDEKGEEVRMFE